MIALLRWIGWRGTLSRLGRTTLTTLGIALGISLYSAIALINQSTHNSLRDNLEGIAGKAQLTVSAGETGFSEQILEKVKSIDGVKHAVPMIEGRVYFENVKNQNQSIYILGIDLLQETAVRTYKTSNQEIIDDPLIFLNQPDSVIVTKEFSENHQLKIEDPFRITTPSGVRSLTVRGIMLPEGAARAYGGSLGIMDIDGARDFFGKPGKIDRIDLVLRENVNLQELRKKIEVLLGAGFRVEEPKEQVVSQEKMLASYQAMFTILSSLALLVGLFMVYHSISISITERRKEIGILRALGASRLSLITLFSIEGVWIGVLGTALGIFGGWGLSFFLVDKITTSLSNQVHSRVDAHEISYTTGMILSIFALGLLTSWLAAIFPALKGSQIEPAEAMRAGNTIDSDSKEERARKQRWMGFLAVGFFIFATTSIGLGWNRFHPWIEYINQGASFLSALLFGPILALGLLRILRPVFKRRKSTLFRIAHDQIWKSPRKTSANIASLMVGLFLVMMIASIRSSFRHSLLSWISGAITADLVVSSNGRLFTNDSTPMKEELIEEIQKIKGVKKIPPGYGPGTRIYPFEMDGKRFVIKAFDRPTAEVGMGHFSIQGSNVHEKGETLFTAEDPTVLVSENYFEFHPELSIGKSIAIPTPYGGSVKFRIIGKVRDFASSDGVFYLSRSWFQKLWKDHLVSGIAVRVEPGHSPEEVKARIEEKLTKKYGVLCILNQEIKSLMNQAVDSSFAYSKAIEWSALLVGLLGLMNTLLISTLERTKELGVFRAIGGTRSQILRMIFYESILQGTAGALIAVLLGGWMGYLWVTYSLTHALGWIVDFYLPLSNLSLTFLSGMIVASIAGIFPAYRAARMEIVDSLR